jgi:quinol monooxygenase YgiN
MAQVHVGLLVTIKAKPGKEEEVANFLSGALPLANAEPKTVVWFAFRIDRSTFGVYDSFADDGGRNAHLTGPIAQALMARAGELLSEAPKIEKLDVLAAKLT